MDPTDWLPEHAAQLQRLRRSAGLSETELAKKHLITLNQLHQLEEGGVSAFYSARIKFNTGRKLVQFLGEDLATPPHAMPQATTPDDQARAVSPPPFPHPELRTMAHRMAPEEPLTPRRSARWLWVTLFTLLVSTALVLSLAPFEPPRVDVFLPVADSTKPLQTAVSPMTDREDTPLPAEPTVNPAQHSEPPIAPAQPNADAAVAARPAHASGPEAAPPSAHTMGCHWDTPALDLTPTHEDQRTNYIHVVALQAVTLCWRDAQGKSQTVQLKAEETQTLYGQPPFGVSSANPEGFSLFFKGRRVRWPQAGTAHFVLKSP